MSLFDLLIYSASGGFVIVALMHSLIGERLLIGPILATGDHPVLRDSLGRFVIRAAWHLTSVLWLKLAIMLAAIVIAPDALASVMMAVVGWGTMAAGLGDAVFSRGRHIGWPVLTIIGASLVWAVSIA